MERFESAFGESFTLVAIDAPFDTRADRISARGRDTPTEEGGESLLSAIPAADSSSGTGLFFH